MSVENRGTTDVPRWYYSFMIPECVISVRFLKLEQKPKP